jgi:signal transduction histidine kinase
MTGSDALIVQGRVDRDGRLIAADARLAALNLRAGGEEGGVLAIPQLASLARLARTLGVLVSRGVIAADGSENLDLWVRAKAEGDEVQLSIGGWTARPVPKPDAHLAAARLRDFARLEEVGRWEVDDAFLLGTLDDALHRLIGPSARALTGAEVTRLFRLIEDEAGDLPLLSGFATRSAFAGQHAHLRAHPHFRLRLHGEPQAKPDGSFAGFSCGYALDDRALLIPVPIEVATDSGFAERLDEALRAPISRIIANADEISGRGDGPVRGDYVAYASDIAAAGRHLLGLVDDLADVQSVEQPGFVVDSENVDLADCARRAAGLLGVRATDKQVRIDAPPLDEALEAQGDFRRILQILVNLISNAVRYSPAGSNIWIRTEQENDVAAIIVADQGKGIAPEDQERIFDKFERVDPSEPGGSGLGLYISRQLARAMGGDITVDSAPGQGARFVLTLPVVPV